MSKNSLNPKSFPAWMERGALPAVDVKGINKEADAIRKKFRSPFGFCGPKRSKG